MRRPFLSRAATLHIVASWAAARLLVAIAYGLVVAWDRWRGLGDGPGRLTLDQGLLAWDGSWYEWIAQQGYADSPDGVLRFFPLYPLLGRWSAPAVGGRDGVALVLLSNVAALVAAVLLFVLVRSVLNEAAARRSVWILALYPASFVLVFAYSESLFLAAAIGTLLALRSRRYELAGLLGFAATLTRSLGVLLVIVVVADALTERRNLSARDTARRSLAALGPVAGLALHLRWTQVTFGSWRAPIDAQSDTRGDFENPAFRAVEALTDGVRGDETSLLHGIVFFALLALLWAARRRIPGSYLVWAVIGLAIGMSAQTINSFERYAISLIPLILAAASVSVDRRTGRLALAGASLGFVALAGAAFAGQYVP